MTARRPIRHNYPFDPSHGYNREQLLAMTAPAEPADFSDFWRQRRKRALHVPSSIRLRDTGWDDAGWRVFRITYLSTEQAVIRGWLLIPQHGRILRGFVIGHGYAGREAPDLDLPFHDAALLFPALRGMQHSPYPDTSPEPRWHVLHHIQDRERYVLGGCVDDTWLAVSALLRLYPQLQGHIGYLGISFGGGIGALALPWEDRISRAHLNVPTFGHQRLRLQLDSVGSAKSVQQFVRQHPAVTKNLDYFDAAIAARRIRIPVHCALAGFDPFVAPAGQYAIYNALAGSSRLFELTAGHHPYPARRKEQAALREELAEFFADM